MLMRQFKTISPVYGENFQQPSTRMLKRKHRNISRLTLHFMSERNCGEKIVAAGYYKWEFMQLATTTTRTVNINKCEAFPRYKLLFVRKMRRLSVISCEQRAYITDIYLIERKLFGRRHRGLSERINLIESNCGDFVRILFWETKKKMHFVRCDVRSFIRWLSACFLNGF